MSSQRKPVFEYGLDKVLSEGGGLTQEMERF